MWRDAPLRVGYVTKRYPRYSETFVVAEIAAHEAAGLEVEIFSLFPSLVADYFGTRFATANYGAMYSAKGVASIIGSGVAAMLYEHFGTWSACFYGSAVLALMAAVTAFGLRATRGAREVPLPAPAG